MAGHRQWCALFFHRCLFIANERAKSAGSAAHNKSRIIYKLLHFRRRKFRPSRANIVRIHVYTLFAHWLLSGIRSLGQILWGHARRGWVCFAIKSPEMIIKNDIRQFTLCPVQSNGVLLCTSNLPSSSSFFGRSGGRSVLASDELAH